MKLLASFLAAATAQDWASPDNIPSEWRIVEEHGDDIPELINDMIFTKCQADFLQSNHNISVHGGPNVDYDVPCDPIVPNALHGAVPYWKNNKNQSTGKWDVCYYFDPSAGHSSSQKEKIRNKLAEFNRDTCVNVFECDRNDSRYSKKLRIEKGFGCASYVGMHMADQMLSLANNCENSHIPLHEVMHALGWLHEHQRGDRDNHVKVWPERCTMQGQSYEGNMGKMGSEWQNDGSPYDTSSVMHYSTTSCARSRNQPVITKPDGSTLTLTVGDSLSEHDIWSINQIYTCDDAGPGPTPQPTTRQPGTTTAGPDGNCDCTKVKLTNKASYNAADQGTYVRLDEEYNGKPAYYKKKDPDIWYDADRYLYFSESICPRKGPSWIINKVLANTGSYYRRAASGDSCEIMDAADWSVACDIECIERSGPTTTEKPTTKPTTPNPTTKPTKPPTTKPKTTKAPTCNGECCDLEDVGGYYKILSATNGNKNGSVASVGCKQHYRLNLEWPKDPYVYGKLKTNATCKCDASGQCKWVFNKGNVVCSHCPRETLQARKGKKQAFIEWDTGIAIYFPITVDSKSTNGWHVGLDFNASLEGLEGSGSVQVGGRGKRSATATLVTEEQMNDHHARAKRHAGLVSGGDDEDALEEVGGDDIRYTKCQADIFKRNGINIPDTHVHVVENDELCDKNEAPKALDDSVPYWTDHFNSRTNKYEVPYMFDGSHSEDVKNTIRRKLDEFKRDTCVELVEIPWESKSSGPFGGKYNNVFSVTKNGGCASYVGKVIKKQTLWLGSRCENSYIPLHEFMHGLGWWHEQQRGDFAQHVKIWPERCSMTGSSFDVNFGSISNKWDRDGTPYDFGSIMHYSTTSCARDRSKPVITKPDGSLLTLTKGDSLSEWDIKQINMVYKCDLLPPTTTAPPTTKPPTTVPPTTPEPEPESILVRAGNMDLTGVSRDNRLWTFTPNTEKLDVENLEKSKIYLMAYFDNLTPEDIETAKGAALLYFKYPMPDNDASCLLDRFEDYPLQ